MRAAFVANTVTASTVRAVNYEPVVDRLRTSGGDKTRPLKRWVTKLGEAYAAVLTRIDCEPNHGDELLSQVDAFALNPEGRWIRGDRMRFVEELRVQRGDILIAGAGQIGPSTLFGRSVIADARLEGKLASGDIMLVRGGGFEDEDVLFLYAFLSSKIGTAAVRSCAYGTSIPRIRPDLFAELPVPIPDPGTKRRIAERVRKCIVLRERYASCLAAARMAIEQLPEMRAAHAMCAETRARCIVWTGELRSLAAWNLASAGEALDFLSRRWSTRVSEQTVSEGVFFGNLRKRAPCDPGHGFPLISQRDLHHLRVFPMWIQNPSIDHATVFSPPSSIAMAGEGSTGEGDLLGRPAFINKRLSGYALTEHVLRIVPKPDCAAILHTFLSTIVGIRLVRTTAAGTIVQKLRRDLIRELPAPQLDPATAQLVNTNHAAAFSALDESLAAEDDAIRTMESEVLPQWLA